MSEDVLYKSILRRSAPRAILLHPGQLLPGQAAFADDTNELLYRKRLNASVGAGEIVVYPPDGGAKKPYVHIQSSPQAVWLVAHGLGTTEPDVTVYNSQGKQVWTDVEIVDPDHLKVIFNSAEFGRAKVS